MLVFFTGSKEILDGFYFMNSTRNNSLTRLMALFIFLLMFLITFYDLEFSSRNISSFYIFDIFRALNDALILMNFLLIN